LKLSLKDVQDEIAQIRKAHFKLKDDAAFVYWFLRAYLANSDGEALNALTGDKSDKNIDAILVDKKFDQVHLIQGKYRQSQDHSEKRNDVLSFAKLSSYPWESKSFLQEFYSEIDPLVREKFEELVLAVRRGKSKLRLYYVTTGRCTSGIVKEAEQLARQAPGSTDVSIIDGGQVLTMYKDYVEGVAPAVPELFLKMASEPGVQNEGVIHRLAPKAGIESWVFSMPAKEVGEMYAKTGVRLFARNIRGFLGTTEINKAMTETIKKEPENFWYYNNGVTIVCDDLKRETHGGEDYLRVDRPQVINGQQTTRVLHDSSADGGSVLVKAIKIPRQPGDDQEYDRLVNSIVRATNWQNHIEASDLVSNDYIQVFIERALRKLGYQYIRKRQTKAEARRLYGHGYYQIDKRELAQSVAACYFDPAVLREGKERLFEDPYYKSIFSSPSMSYYLSKFWLMRQLRYVSSGHPEWAYAKWLVLHFAWKETSDLIGSGQGEARFRQNSEKFSYNDVLTPLHGAIEAMFRAALVFFRKERGSGEEAVDVSSFFRFTKLDQRFNRFWDSPGNPYRTKVKEHLKVFRVRLKTAVETDNS
jgi:hypothetical protein